MALEKDHSMIEMRRLKNVVIFLQTILKCCPVKKYYKCLQRFSTEIWKCYG